MTMTPQQHNISRGKPSSYGIKFNWGIAQCHTIKSLGHTSQCEPSSWSSHSMTWHSNDSKPGRGKVEWWWLNVLFQKQQNTPPNEKSLFLHHSIINKCSIIRSVLWFELSISIGCQVEWDQVSPTEHWPLLLPARIIILGKEGPRLVAVLLDQSMMRRKYWFHPRIHLSQKDHCVYRVTGQRCWEGGGEWSWQRNILLANLDLNISI